MLFGRKYQFTRRHIPEDLNFHIYSRESFKSRVFHLDYQENRELQSTDVTQINTSAVLINFTGPRLSIRYTCKLFLRQKTGNLGSVIVQLCAYTTLTKYNWNIFKNCLEVKICNTDCFLYHFQRILKQEIMNVSEVKGLPAVKATLSWCDVCVCCSCQFEAFILRSLMTPRLLLPSVRSSVQFPVTH